MQAVKMRRLKKADCEVDFFFIDEVVFPCGVREWRSYRPCRNRVNIFLNLSRSFSRDCRAFGLPSDLSATVTALVHSPRNGNSPVTNSSLQSWTSLSCLRACRALAGSPFRRLRQLRASLVGTRRPQRVGPASAGRLCRLIPAPLAIHLPSVRAGLALSEKPIHLRDPSPIAFGEVDHLGQRDGPAPGSPIPATTDHLSLIA